EVTWTVEVCIPECVIALYEHAIAEANFTVNYEIDMHGHTRRTFSGFLRIAINRTGRRLNDNADNYRERFVPQVPLNFRRHDQKFRLSEDKARLDVSVVDEELRSPNVPPPGVVTAKVKHSLGNQGPRAWTKQLGRVSGQYTVARGFPPVVAVEHF